MKKRAFYVTGTDTDIGKTFVSCALLHHLRAAGERVVGMKPVAAGCQRVAGGWQNSDAQALQAASLPVPDYRYVNPFALPQPTAPEIAGAQVGVAVTLPPIRRAFAQLQLQADWLVVEGVGGWAAPLSKDLDQQTLVEQLNLAVVLVVGLRLGCVNHARLTASAIAAAKANCVGWVANVIDPKMTNLVETLTILRTRLAIPFWGFLPWQPQSQTVIWQHRPDLRGLVCA